MVYIVFWNIYHETIPRPWRRAAECSGPRCWGPCSPQPRPAAQRTDPPGT